MAVKTDNDVIRVFLPLLNTALNATAYAPVTIVQSYQPTQQGVDSDPQVYFFKTGHRRYGFLKRFDQWNDISQEMEHVESQWIESQWQISALLRQNPATPNQFTASDLVNEVAAILQSDTIRIALMNEGIGILRIENVSNPYFVDDFENFEASPSFTFTLTYQNSRVSTNPIVSEFNNKIIGV